MGGLAPSSKKVGGGLGPTGPPSMGMLSGGGGFRAKYINIGAFFAMKHFTS